MTLFILFISMYQVMLFSKDKKQQRYQMVTYALKHGVKPTARIYDTTDGVILRVLEKKHLRYKSYMDS